MSVTAAILLAASDARAGGAPLPLLPWFEDDALIEWQAEALLAGGIDVIEVVLGIDAEALIPLVARDDVEPIVHAGWRTDPAGAVRIGATATPRNTIAALILDIAQPRPPTVVRELLVAHNASGAPITRPACGGMPGAPVVVNADVLAEVRNSSAEAGGLQAILDRHAQETQLVEMNDPVVLLEITDAQSADRLRALTIGA